MTEMRDFTKKRKDISFRVDDDLFHAARGVPADVLLDFATEFSSMDTTATVDQQLRAFRSMLEVVLLPESLERFTARMRDRENPIEIDQVEEIVTWLMEQYGLRPTEPSSASPSGPSGPGPGTTLTASTPAEVSISAASPSIAS
ncbi:hypothetical protein [Streptomyces sp. NRRL S-455]|uniref:hypothetical protein n=1 Tax=Streptomyces sp. NRRL S-455 TaxID=1463908 RepID=UPI0004BE5552|nr:hypothetical protein [Streptomyces sp. NRRL S-455]